MLRQVIDRENTGSQVWADSAYRSQSNEAWLSDRMLTSRIHRRKPKGKPIDMPPLFRTTLSWNFPVMIPDREMERSDEGIEVF